MRVGHSSRQTEYALDVYVSAAPRWEVAIKQAIGKLEPEDLPERVRDSGFRHLDITSAHGIAAARLPQIGFVREFGRQMFATFGATLPAPIAAMFARTGTTRGS
ncbi:type II toxin-antitoxin system VapC family toxin [Paractinoplanes ferrugineus]|uniref:type II toxin-antitoxin system VapC family toxin n=1 Tax=Paractinoplanes ferrugineus TaxID=113564 RepID=UPI001943462E|nr:hypothetical protein [Actinoplanes ferrugineus]